MMAMGLREIVGTVRVVARHSQSFWFLAEVIGLFSINMVSFSRNVVLRDPLFSLNVVWKRAMLSV
jgi:hypothetical protein